MIMIVIIIIITLIILIITIIRALPAAAAEGALAAGPARPLARRGALRPEAVGSFMQNMSSLLKAPIAGAKYIAHVDCDQLNFNML